MEWLVIAAGLALAFANGANDNIKGVATLYGSAQLGYRSAITLATAWSMNFDFVASTIIGARTADQLDESLAALDVKLSDEVMQQCEEVHNQILYPMG